MKTSHASSNLLDELQGALAHGTLARRVETLRRITDLFLNPEMDYSSEQIDVFDDVFHCLVRDIEVSAKALLATRLAPVETAPPRIIQTLAFDDAIEVAAPVLSQSVRLDDATLAENARSKSQGHLLAISTRKTLTGTVTDVLVERGNNEVVQSTVRNSGAEFSESGFTTLVARAEHDADLALCVAARPAMPRHHYLKLVARASSAVRARLEEALPLQRHDISEAVEKAATGARTAPAVLGAQTIVARRLVNSLFNDGRLDDDQVIAFAEHGKFDETSAALASLANVPIVIAETMVMEARAEGLLILAKVAGLSWPAVDAILKMRADLSGLTADNADVTQESYERLRTSTAQQVLRFYRMEQSVSNDLPAA